MRLVTNDVYTLTVPAAVVARCGTLSTAAATAGDDAAPVPVPNVSSVALSRVVQYFTRLEAFERLAERDDWESEPDVARWKVGFFESMERRVLYDVMEAANYLDARGLLDSAADYVADLLRGKTPDEIREILLLPRDMTAEEVRAAAEEYAWALA